MKSETVVREERVEVPKEERAAVAFPEDLLRKAGPTCGVVPVVPRIGRSEPAPAERDGRGRPAGIGLLGNVPYRFRET
jgi:hypothetical protein